MSEYVYELKIPLERVAVLIGKSGETKQRLEEATKTRIEVNSEEGDVKIRGEQSLELFTAQEIVK
ncbi:RNA-processing protein, partial [Candidatus Woesearchaeota archaeon CG_4_10_14_0_8_um_filter_47_5]